MKAAFNLGPEFRLAVNAGFIRIAASLYVPEFHFPDLENYDNTSMAYPRWSLW